MNEAVVYCSQTGFTEKYARWLAEELDCVATPFRMRSDVDLDTTDLLVFCSWFHAASIKGARWLKKAMESHPNLSVIVLATGATPMPGAGWSTKDSINEAFARTFPKSEYPDLPCFYCHGGYDFDKLGAADKLAMRMFCKMHDKSEDPKERETLAIMRKGFDGTRREYLAPLLEYVRTL